MMAEGYTSCRSRAHCTYNSLDYLSSLYRTGCNKEMKKKTRDVEPTRRILKMSVCTIGDIAITNDTSNGNPRLTPVASDKQLVYTSINVLLSQLSITFVLP